jgi:diguanylate cyclase (GGDEF)-like protein
VDCLIIDAGLVLARRSRGALWEINQGLVALTLLPLALAYRSLAIPGLVEASRIEPKTRLYNMRHFQSVLSQELQRAARFERPLAVLMIDVDHLREINTTRGHLAGDRALKSVANALQRATREYDVPARFGGDEFCVVLPETDLEGALVVAERIRSFVESASDPEVTVSVGSPRIREGGRRPTRSSRWPPAPPTGGSSAAETPSPCRPRETRSTRPNASCTTPRARREHSFSNRRIGPINP